MQGSTLNVFYLKLFFKPRKISKLWELVWIYQLNSKANLALLTLPICTIRNKSWKCAGKSVLLDNVFLTKKNNFIIAKNKSGEPFRICLLNSTANPAHYHPNLAELAVPPNSQTAPTIFFIKKKFPQNTLPEHFHDLFLIV